jgi:serine protease Do
MSPRRFSFSFGGLAILAGAWLVPFHGLSAGEPPAPPPALPAPGTASVAEALGREVRGVVARCEKAVCRIVATDDLGPVRGTGFFIDADGTLLTTFSVAGETQDLMVEVGEEAYPAALLVADARSGLAILKIDAPEPMPFVQMGRSTELVAGSPVVALGYPMDLDLSPSFGLIAGFDLGFKGRYFATRHLRANLAVQRGQGGSPILNMRGEAVGVLVSTVEGDSGIFALPMEAARKVLHDVREYGHLRPGWLGADVGTLKAPVEGSTARLSGLRSAGPGEKGGLQTDDVILQIGEWKIAVPGDVLSASFYVTATEAVTVRVARDGKIVELNILPEDPPAGVLPTVERKRAETASPPENLTLGK